MNTNLNTEHEHEHEPKFQENHVFFRNIIIFYENHLIYATNINFCEVCETGARFQKGDVIFANSVKKTHVSQGYNL